MSGGLSSPGRRLTGGGALSTPGVANLPQPRRWWVLLGCALLALLLLVTSGLLLSRAQQQPDNLREAVLVGDLPDAPIRLVIVLDVSGSMQSYWPAREAALRDLVAWSARVLRPDDTISVFVFAETGQLLLPETPVAQLKGGAMRLAPIGDVGGGTDLAGVLPVLEANLGPEPHVFAWITDSEIVDVARDRVLRTTSRLGMIGSTTILPRGGRPDAAWQAALPGTRYEHIDPANPDEVGLALARTIAHATGVKVRMR